MSDDTTIIRYSDYLYGKCQNRKLESYISCCKSVFGYIQITVNKEPIISESIKTKTAI